MPGLNQKIGETIPKTGAYEYSAKRLQGLPLKLNTAESGLTSAGPGQIVSIQQDANGILWAVVGHLPYVSDTYDTWIVVGYGILEEALQSNTNGSIAPDANTFTDDTMVVVVRGVNDVFQVKVDPANVPNSGIAQATIDNQGRLSSVAADADHKAVKGATFTGKMTLSMDSQLQPNFTFFQPYSAVEL